MFERFKVLKAIHGISKINRSIDEDDVKSSNLKAYREGNDEVKFTFKKMFTRWNESGKAERVGQLYCKLSVRLERQAGDISIDALKTLAIL